MRQLFPTIRKTSDEQRAKLSAPNDKQRIEALEKEIEALKSTLVSKGILPVSDNK